jgi:hypothetical protein
MSKSRARFSLPLVAALLASASCSGDPTDDSGPETSGGNPSAGTTGAGVAGVGGSDAGAAGVSGAAGSAGATGGGVAGAVAGGAGPGGGSSGVAGISGAAGTPGGTAGIGGAGGSADAGGAGTPIAGNAGTGGIAGGGGDAGASGSAGIGGAGAAGSAGAGGAGAGAGGASAGAGAGGVSGSSGASGSAGTSGSSGSAGSPPVGGCGVTSDRVRITEIDVGVTIVANEDEAALKPIVISPVPSGGSRVAFMSNDGKVHVRTLDASDQVTGSAASFTANDFADIHADDAGGAILLTRSAQGGGTLNCGNPSNLCGTPPNPPIPCYDMYLVRFDGTTESWATKLTESSAALPPYSTGPTGANVTMIWWYAHHGRIAYSGSNYAAYYAAAISTSEGGCINIHQGDRMNVVSGSGQSASGGFGWGCSHSGYEHVIWDPGANKFVAVCQNDAPTSGKSGRLAYAPQTSTLLPVDLWYSNVSDLELASGGGYWTITSDARSGQPANANGLAELRLLRFTTGAPSQNLVIASDASLNVRAPHLAAYGSDRMIAAWETSTRTGHLAANDNTRKLYVQTLSRSNGAAEGNALEVAVKGNRYHELVAFPDGSVAYPAPGSSATRLKILRVLPCTG